MALSSVADARLRNVASKCCAASTGDGPVAAASCWTTHRACSPTGVPGIFDTETAGAVLDVADRLADRGGTGTAADDDGKGEISGSPEPECFGSCDF